MMKIIAIAALLTLLSMPALADWTATQTSLGVAALTATVIDWGQTRHIAKNQHLFHEKNPILGRHPSVSRVDAYFATAIVSGAVIAYMLPSEYRSWFLGGVLALELVVTARNQRLGIKVSF